MCLFPIIIIIIIVASKACKCEASTNKMNVFRWSHIKGGASEEEDGWLGLQKWNFEERLVRKDARNRGVALFAFQMCELGCCLVLIWFFLFFFGVALRIHPTPSLFWASGHSLLTDLSSRCAQERHKAKPHHCGAMNSRPQKGIYTKHTLVSNLLHSFFLSLTI